MKASLLFVLLLALPCSAQDTNSPVTMRYIDKTEYNKHRQMPSDTGVFCVTNRTTSRFMLFLTDHEVNFGSNWVRRPLPAMKQLVFNPTMTNHFTGSPILYGNSETYCDVPPPTSVVNGMVWRARLSLIKVENGDENKMVGLKNEPRLLKRRFVKGDTNTPVNPFNTKFNYITETNLIVTPVVPD